MGENSKLAPILELACKMLRENEARCTKNAYVENVVGRAGAKSNFVTL